MFWLTVSNSTHTHTHINEFIYTVNKQFCILYRSIYVFISFSGCACPRLAKKTQEAESCLERVLNSLESRQQPGVWRLFKWITQGSLIGESPARLNPFEYTNLNKRQTISFGTIWNIQCEIEKLSILLMWITCTISFLKYTVMFAQLVHDCYGETKNTSPPAVGMRKTR